jgi:hypothetical protein
VIHLDRDVSVYASVPECEIVTVALIWAKYVAKNHRSALNVIHQVRYEAGSISHVRLNRLHAFRDEMGHMPEILADMLSIPIFYRMPISLCLGVRAKRCSKVAGARYDGKCHAKDERYFG